MALGLIGAAIVILLLLREIGNLRSQIDGSRHLSRHMIAEAKRKGDEL